MEIEHLSKAYGDKLILDNIGLIINRGEKVRPGGPFAPPVQGRHRTNQKSARGPHQRGAGPPEGTGGYTVYHRAGQDFQGQYTPEGGGKCECQEPGPGIGGERYRIDPQCQP